MLPDLKSEKQKNIFGGAPPRAKPAKGINLSLSLAYPMLIPSEWYRSGNGKDSLVDGQSPTV